MATLKPRLLSRAGGSTVYIEYSHVGTRKRFNSGIKLPPDEVKFFNKKATLNPFEVGVKQRSEKNRVFNEFYSFLNQIKDDHNYSPLQADQFEKIFNQEVSKKEKSRLSRLVELDQYFEIYKKETDKKDGSGDLSSGSIKARNSHISVFEKFLAENKDSKDFSFSPAGINTEMYKSFKKWAYKKKGFKVNYFGALVKDVKFFFSFLEDKGFDLENYKPKKWIKPAFNPKNPLYLLETELNKIIDYPESKLSEKLQRTRDLVVFQALTGLRISDLKRINKSHYISGEDFNRLDIVQQKNKKPYKMPLDPVADQILRKYHFKLPTISDQKHNEYIKELCEKIELKREIVEESRPGGKLTEQRFKLHERISSHDMVHTFCTLKIAKGITPKTLSTIIGKDVKTIIDHYYGQDLVDFEQDLIKTFV